MTSIAPIAWSKVRWCKPSPADLDNIALTDYPFYDDGRAKFRMVEYFQEPAVLCGYEDWFKGNDVEWVFFNETIFIVQSGSAEMTYWNGPTWQERGTVTCEPGMVLFLPRGARVWFHITSDEPFRRIVFDIPNPGFVFEKAGG